MIASGQGARSAVSAPPPTSPSEHDASALVRAQVGKDPWEVGEERPRARPVGTRRTSCFLHRDRGDGRDARRLCLRLDGGGASDTGIASKPARPAATACPHSATHGCEQPRRRAPGERGAGPGPRQPRLCRTIALSPTASQGRKPTTRGQTRQRTSCRPRPCSSTTIEQPGRTGDAAAAARDPSGHTGRRG